MNDERLRTAYQDALRARAVRDRSPCVPPEAILALVRRSGPEAERLATLDHVMACAACRRELDVLRAVERAGVDTGAEPAASGNVVPLSAPRPRLAPARRPVVALALAASVLAAVGVARLLQRPDDAPDVLRGDAKGVEATLPERGATVRPPVTFAWHPVPGASRYAVEVVAPGGRAAWTTETSATSATLSAALPPGEYRWWVRVVGGAADGRSSEPRPLRVGE
jgi:hypothetical protein